MEKFPGQRPLREWLLSDETPNTKLATETIFNKKNLTENMIDALNADEDAEMRELVGRYGEILVDKNVNYKPEGKAEMKKIEERVAEIMETAFER